MLTKKFEETILKHNMFSHGSSIVCGISGGSDSVCLLHLLYSLKDKYALKIYAVHINHGIRATAKRDEDFVKNLCDKWGIAFFPFHYNVPQMAKEQKISEELCGREVRYAAFHETAQKNGCQSIFTAHNKNDNAETFLLHLIRGSGSGGLSSMQPKSGSLCRPLLFCTKAEIEEYLRQNNITWVEDETNNTDLYTRNFLRHEIIPRLRQINPSAEDTILRSAALLKEDNDYLSYLAEHSGAYKENGSIDTTILTALPPPLANRVVLKALKAEGFEISENIVQNILKLSKKPSGKSFVLPCGGRAVKEYDEITFLQKDNHKDYLYTLKKGEKLFIDEAGVAVSLTDTKPEKPFLVLSGHCTTLLVRPPKKGDTFLPSGMGGHKKLSDFFADKKIPLSKREKIPIFIFENEIAAVGDMRAGENFASPDKNNALYLKISGQV